MSDETNDKLAERIREIFPSPEVASKVVDMVVHNKPIGWGKGSNAPYYKEIYAKQIKADIDKMMQSGMMIVYRYTIWCGEREERMSRQTLYNRINQSMRYLLEKMDLDGRYKRWRETVRIERSFERKAVVIYYIPGLGNDVLEGEEAMPREHLPIWKQKLEQWLESDEMRPFCQEGLALSEEEIKQLKIELANLVNIEVDVKPSHVKIIKTR